MRRATNQPSGYALVWVLVTIAVIAAVMAAAAPSLVTLDDRKRAEKTVELLRVVGAGVFDFNQTVGHYPGNLSDLTQPITTSSKNSCGGAMKASEVGNWSGGAPYVPFYMPPTGIWTPIGRIRDAIPTRTAADPLLIDFPGVSAEDAEMVNVIVDHGTGDSVYYNTPVNDTTTLHIRIPATYLANSC